MEADQVLSWNELRGRNYGVAGRAVSGTVRATVPGGGREPEVLRFWHAPPERWQVEDGQGVRQVFGPGGRFVRGDCGRMRRLSPNVSVGFEQGHPSQLVVAHRRWPVEDPHAQAVAPVSWPPAAVQRSGRAAWEVVLQGPQIPRLEQAALTTRSGGNSRCGPASRSLPRRPRLLSATSWYAGDR